MFERMYRPYTSINNVLVEKGAELLENQGRAFDQLAERFSSQIPDNVFTPAQLQGYLLHHRNSPEKAADCILTWVVQEKAIMDEAQRRMKASAERRAKKKALKRLKAFKTLAPDVENEEPHKESENGAENAQASKAPMKQAKDSQNKHYSENPGTKQTEDVSDVDTHQTDIDVPGQS
ncbi:uncharacterized protein ColSpa_00697 [Colletotrichum spaethianum]|uniref:Mitochondrial chaperone BCS1-like ATPase lid domain-containing protein n=1 Tax=Colletotrichum spaethianum TaxID=700344 RepID=A0AA37L2J7_9PEZI|nr:uncharacterized protein ColSpa_00697 [Colletotrichum spaethianum]GKT40516.1 hypothetical protein ColSpa_00697 [Colletotrichum spaethianum]